MVDESEGYVLRKLYHRGADAEELGFDRGPDLVDETGLEKVVVDASATEDGAVVPARVLEGGSDICRGFRAEFENLRLSVGGKAIGRAGEDDAESRRIEITQQVGADRFVGDPAHHIRVKLGETPPEPSLVGGGSPRGARKIMFGDKPVERLSRD